MIKINHSVVEDSSGDVKESRTEPYVIFKVNNEEFGVEAKKVLELVKYMPPLSMTNNYQNACGMNVFRGKIVPIVDMRMVFGLERLIYNDHTVIIMVESSISDFGIIVEQVMDLGYFPVTSIKTVTGFNLGEKTKYLKSVANIDGRLILLIDTEKMVELKRKQTGLEDTGASQSLTKIETPSVSEESPRVAEVDVSESSEVQTHGTGSLVEPAVKQIGDQKPAAYLIDQQELDDLLKEIGPLEEKVEPVFSLNEAKKDLEGTFDTGPDPSGDDCKADPMETEEVAQTLADLGAEWVSPLPEKVETTPEIESYPQLSEQSLSDETIEDILKELEAEIQLKDERTEADPNDQILKIEKRESTGENYHD